MGGPFDALTKPVSSPENSPLQRLSLQVTEQYRSLNPELLPQQNPNRVQDLAQAIRTTDNLTPQAATGKATEILRLLDAVQNGKTTDERSGLEIGERLKQVISCRAFEANTGIAQVDDFIRRSNLQIDVSLREGNFDVAYDAATRASQVTDNAGIVAIINMPQIPRSELGEILYMIQNLPLLQISSALTRWESAHENLGISNEIAAAVERMDAYMLGMRNPNANFEDILAAMRSTTQEEFEKYASRFLNDNQMASILSRANDIVADTGAGFEVANITQQIIGFMLEQIRMISEDLEFSKRLEDDIDKAIKDARDRDDGEKYSSISEAIPEGFFSAVGVSEDSKTLAEMLTGVMVYDAAEVDRILRSNPELAENVAAFFTSHA